MQIGVPIFVPCTEGGGSGQCRAVLEVLVSSGRTPSNSAVRPPCLRLPPPRDGRPPRDARPSPGAPQPLIWRFRICHNVHLPAPGSFWPQVHSNPPCARMRGARLARCDERCSGSLTLAFGRSLCPQHHDPSVERSKAERSSFRQVIPAFPVSQCPPWCTAAVFREW